MTTNCLSVENVCKFSLKNVNLEIKDGEHLTILGSSGSGKTTLLRLIAGLSQPDQGQIKLHNRVVSNPRSFVSPEDRGIGMVFQNYGLFPHLTVEKNIVFGLHKESRETRCERLNELVKLVNLVGLEKRYPHQLSGGEQQRVALARTLALKPKVILFDEPFSHLDENLREEIRQEVLRILDYNETTAIFVTHDQSDALCLSDRIAILNNGQIEQVGSPVELFNSPESIYVARYFGHSNLIMATTTQTGYDTAIGDIPFKHNTEPGRKGILSIRPQWCVLDNVHPHFKGTVKQSRFIGQCHEVILDVPGESEFIVHMFNAKDFTEGSQLGIRIEAPSLQLIAKQN